MSVPQDLLDEYAASRAMARRERVDAFMQATPSMCNDIRSCVAEGDTLAATMKGLLDKVTAGGVDREFCMEALTAMQNSFGNVLYYQRKMLIGHWAEYCPPHAMHVAQKVFDVPELLENILAYLHPRELLQISSINRQFKDAVQSSTRLQRQLSMLPQSSPNAYSPFEKQAFPAMDFSWNSLGVDREYRKACKTDSSVRHALVVFPCPLPKVGVVPRRMLVAYPVLKEMRPIHTCCYADQEHEQLIEECTVRNKDGITVGDLLDAAEKFSVGMRDCALAATDCHLSDGTVSVPIAYEGVVYMHAKDPARVAKETKLEERRMIKKYSRAKKTGELTIITLKWMQKLKAK